jgi:DNA-binding MarR family transcriptional regulator
MSGMLVALGSDLSRLLDHLTRRHGSITYSQYQLVALLRSTHPEPWEPWELGKRLGNGSAHVTMLLDQLERAGLVVRETHVQDRRRRLIRLTPEGHDRAERLGAQVRRVEEHIFGSALSDDELGQLKIAGERLRALLAEFTAPDLSFLLVADPGRPPAAE